jgi:putative transposase
MSVQVQSRVPFTVRSLWRDADTERIFRVVYSDMQRTDLCPIVGRHLRFVRYATADLRVSTDDGYRGTGRMVAVLDDPFAARNRTCRPLDGHTAKSAKVWSRIRYLVEPEDEDHTRAIRRLLDRATRGRLTREAAELAHVQPKAIHGDLLRYFQRGMNQWAVSSDLPNCGRARKGGSYRSEHDGKRVPRNYRARPGRKSRSQRLHPERQCMLPSQQLTCLLWRGVDLLLTESEAPWLEALGIREKSIGKSEKEKADAIARRVSRELEQIKRSGRAKQLKRRGRSRATYGEVCIALNKLARTQREVRDQLGHLVELKLGNVGIVSRRQFAYFCQTEPEVRALLAARRHRYTGPVLLHGHGDQLIKGPGDRYILDATVGDIYLVSRLDRTVVVGRPTVYFLIDTFSRMIVGLRVSFERPSYEAAASVIESAVTPKVDFCARYGVYITFGDWPCHALSASILTDRGSEFMATEPWQRLAQLGISISNCRPYTPTWRAILERRWGIVPLTWQRQVPGVVECDWHERGQRNYSSDAIFTLNEFMTEVLRGVLIYHKTPITGYSPHPGLVFAREACTPLNLWRWGIENLSGTLYEHSIQDIQLATWYPDRGLLTAGGVRFKGKCYSSRETEASCLDRLARKDRHVSIHIDPDDLDRIWVELDGHPVYCAADGNRVPANGVSWVERQQYVDQKNANDLEENFARQPERIMQLNDARVDAEIAKTRTRNALKDAGKRHPTSAGMSDVRQEENELNRKVEWQARSHAGPSRAGTSSPPKPQPKPVRSLREEREAAALDRLRPSRKA